MVANKNPASQVIAERMLSFGDGNVSRHLDELLESGNSDLENKGSYLSIFLEAVELIRASGDLRTAIWVVSLPATDNLEIAAVLDAEEVLATAENSTFYLFHGSDIFIDAHQEYRVKVRISTSYGDIRVVYRSWRSDEAEKNGWEFNNDVYLWSVDGQLELSGGNRMN